ncbi:MAG: NAD-dependent epimerase/dehydratase family protein [Bacteroidetes bacterium]|nr:NAD-dependent epimerase/dehydratase family protein [Bacteroidota bacterium]MBT3748881.1 NAD-dependent epimerase/dehydratase family protein [Bacteroidota bacterium]MBT4401022.1 NAD-dependent epimerase/dehydratase family protein [Bacteroidota bacterium]MBT4412117.1 NAD-dependent epimerase/dehydratase family protein [Bacteroidota bacterium]MBT5427303.1 NAD-dependent epimerase/dehydratase family protein [Bacteroidota bacterium]
MKVLVTGANGLLGANIVQELNRRRIQVRVFVRKNADMSGLDGCDFEVFRGNITHKDAVIEAAHSCDYIIHAAANTGPAPSNYWYYHPVNVSGTKNVIEAAKTTSSKRIVFISTANTMGYGSCEDPGVENRLIDPLFEQSGYARSKLEAENLIVEAVNENQIKAIILNPTFMIGPRDAKPSSGRILLSILNHRLVILPPGGKNFIHVKDVAWASCEALSKGKPGEKYLLANKNLSYKEFFNVVNSISEEKQSLVIIPKAFLVAAGYIGSLLHRLQIKTDLNRINAKILCVHNYYSGQKAARTFSLNYSPLETALEEALDWFAKNEYLQLPNPAYSH